METNHLHYFPTISKEWALRESQRISAGFPEVSEGAGVHSAIWLSVQDSDDEILELHF